MEDDITTVVEEETFPLKFFDRILGIFFSPGKVMSNVKEYPRIGAAAFAALAFAGVGGLYAKRIAEIALEEQSMIYLERYGPNYLDLTGAVQAYASNETLSTVTTIGTILLTPFIAAFLAALALFIITKVFRGFARFGQYYAMFFNIYIVTNLLSLVPTVFMVMNDSALNVLSLGFLMPDGDMTVPLYNLLTSIHLIGLWEAVLVLIGVKVMNEWKFPKAFAVAVLYFAVSVCFTAAVQIGSLMLTDWSFGMMNQFTF